jgi:hypothetical protein
VALTYSTDDTATRTMGVVEALAQEHKSLFVTVLVGTSMIKMTGLLNRVPEIPGSWAEETTDSLSKSVRYQRISRCTRSPANGVWQNQRRATSWFSMRMFTRGWPSKKCDLGGEAEPCSMWCLNIIVKSLRSRSGYNNTGLVSILLLRGITTAVGIYCTEHHCVFDEFIDSHGMYS